MSCLIEIDVRTDVDQVLTDWFTRPVGHIKNMPRDMIWELKQDEMLVVTEDSENGEAESADVISEIPVFEFDVRLDMNEGEFKRIRAAGKKLHKHMQSVNARIKRLSNDEINAEDLQRKLLQSTVSLTVLAWLKRLQKL